MKFNESDLRKSFIAGRTGSHDTYKNFYDELVEQKYNAMRIATKDDIEKVILKRYNIDKKEFQEYNVRKGYTDIKVARKYFIFFTYWFTEISLLYLFKYLHLQNHSSVFYHAKNVSESVVVDKNLKKELILLKELIEDTGVTLEYTSLSHYSRLPRPDFLFTEPKINKS